jgi:hypothetical protein
MEEKCMVTILDGRERSTQEFICPPVAFLSQLGEESQARKTPGLFHSQPL